MNQTLRSIEGILFSTLGLIGLFGTLSWFLMLVSGRPLIGWLKNRKGMKWAPREDTPDSHAQKAGTPSMGGIGIIGAALTGYLGVFFFVISLSLLQVRGGGSVSEFLLFLVFPGLVVAHAVLGYIDDHSKATDRGGLSSKAKLAGQIGLAVAFLAIVFLTREGTRSGIGRFDSVVFNSWPLFIGALLVIIGTSNAVNLTDGIDGLAAGLGVQVALVYAALMSQILNDSPGNFFGSSVTLFWICLGGACLAFLKFNKYPAKVFMGDTGSLALGAALGAGAILTRSVWLLPFIGFIFYIEMFSVIFQVLYFKWTKKRTGEGQRIFRRAPLHHHFELGGWSEWRVVGTFWLVNLFTSIVGLALWYLEILPRFP